MNRDESGLGSAQSRGSQVTQDKVSESCALKARGTMKGHLDGLGHEGRGCYQPLVYRVGFLFRATPIDWPCCLSDITTQHCT